MAEYFVTVAIEGRATCCVEASSEEEAEKIALESGEWEIDEWDLNTRGYNGGFIDAQVSK